jgi:hypothetical protein
MVKVLVALVKVRGQLLSEGGFACAWFFPAAAAARWQY